MIRYNECKQCSDTQRKKDAAGKAMTIGGEEMAFGLTEKMQIKNAMEKVLHVPGNYAGGTLEMAMVFDGNLTEECARQAGADMAALLKSHSEIFRNVRLNVICWEGDDELVKELSSLPLLQMGRALGGFRHAGKRKRPELLAGCLKKFYARSKIILLFTDGNCRVEDERLFRENMHPFLYRKLVILQICRDGQGAEQGSVKVHMGMEKGWML